MRIPSFLYRTRPPNTFISSSFCAVMISRTCLIFYIFSSFLKAFLSCNTVPRLLSCPSSIQESIDFWYLQCKYSEVLHTVIFNSLHCMYLCFFALSTLQYCNVIAKCFNWSPLAEKTCKTHCRFFQPVFRSVLELSARSVVYAPGSCIMALGVMRRYATKEARMSHWIKKRCLLKIKLLSRVYAS